MASVEESVTRRLHLQREALNSSLVTVQSAVTVTVCSVDTVICFGFVVFFTR